VARVCIQGGVICKGVAWQVVWQVKKLLCWCISFDGCFDGLDRENRLCHEMPCHRLRTHLYALLIAVPSPPPPTLLKTLRAPLPRTRDPHTHIALPPSPTLSNPNPYLWPQLGGQCLGHLEARDSRHVPQEQVPASNVHIHIPPWGGGGGGMLVRRGGVQFSSKCEGADEGQVLGVMHACGRVRTPHLPCRVAQAGVRRANTLYQLTESGGHALAPHGFVLLLLLLLLLPLAAAVHCLRLCCCCEQMLRLQVLIRRYLPPPCCCPPAGVAAAAAHAPAVSHHILR
jgi:hypothetical protein